MNKTLSFAILHFSVAFTLGYLFTGSLLVGGMLALVEPATNTVVFVEVKTRATDVITKPEEAVDRRKIRNIGMAANTYVKMLNVLDELRFDVVSVIGGTKETAQVEHIVDAFNPCLAFRMLSFQC